ncbi:hypothetical protein KIPB_002703 [Kipferlia bialata]|uniref:B30.2/SPRY domain-containing protein n=1 Tax=Kipferlia bialata TaxID=797122 RepID=A0A9K3GG71_9EUKA|nr:hypothetical protein KIPB_002703 [Kipferlia bialata]|eukprot:g2703.t1
MDVQAVPEYQHLHPLALPSSFCFHASSTYLQLSNRARRVSYSSPAGRDAQAASLKSNRAIPVQCGMYYFEATIVEGGINAYLGVGLVPTDSTTYHSRLPGWDAGCIGYHGDDGYLFVGSGTGRGYGQRFGMGDTVGVLVDYLRGDVMFTRNGVALGTACRIPQKNRAGGLHPAVGMRSEGAVIEANFGQRPFQFPFRDHVSSAASAWALRTLRPAPPSAIPCGVVRDHVGVTARALTLGALSSTSGVPGPSVQGATIEASIADRQQVMAACSEGDVEGAREMGAGSSALYRLAFVEALAAGRSDEAVSVAVRHLAAAPPSPPLLSLLGLLGMPQQEARVEAQARVAELRVATSAAVNADALAAIRSGPASHLTGLLCHTLSLLQGGLAPDSDIRSPVVGMLAQLFHGMREREGDRDTPHTAMDTDF